MSIIEGEPRCDERGSLERLFCLQAMATVQPGLHFVQANLTHTLQRGTVRGLHLQAMPAAECKLIRCLRGVAFDVTVDLRPGSATFGHWHAVELSEQNHRSVFIPDGCAHGVQALTDDMQLLYQHTAAYTPECERGVRADDPQLAISWPLPITAWSLRDRAWPSFVGYTRSPS